MILRAGQVTLCVLLVSQLFFRFFWSGGDAPLIALASLKPRSSYALARDGVYDRCIGIQNTRARPTEAALSQLRANDLNATAWLAHYREVLDATAKFRAPLVSPHSAAGYSGPWIEDSWVQRFCCDANESTQARFGGALVPIFVQWVDISSSQATVPRRSCGIR